MQHLQTIHRTAAISRRAEERERFGCRPVAGGTTRASTCGSQRWQQQRAERQGLQMFAAAAQQEETCVESVRPSLPRLQSVSAALKGQNVCAELPTGRNSEGKQRPGGTREIRSIFTDVIASSQSHNGSMQLSRGSLNRHITMATSAVPPLSSLRLVVKINTARKRGRVSAAKPLVLAARTGAAAEDKNTWSHKSPDHHCVHTTRQVADVVTYRQI